MGNLKGLEINPTNLELIKIAKELAYNDYNNRKAELHNRWLAESDAAWRMHKLKVAYPTIPEFPDEDEILNRARKLIEFLDTHRPDLEPKKEEPVVEAREVLPEIIQPEPVVEAEVKQEAPMAEAIAEAPVEQKPVEEIPPVSSEPAAVAETKPTEEKPKEETKPEIDLDYARMKVARKTGDSYVTNKVIPNVINKLQELRNSWR